MRKKLRVLIHTMTTTILRAAWWIRRTRTWAFFPMFAVYGDRWSPTRRSRRRGDRPRRAMESTRVCVVRASSVAAEPSR